MSLYGKEKLKIQIQFANIVFFAGNFVIYIVELFFCFIAFPLNIFFIIIIANTTTLHRNLRILLISTCVADAIYAISRYMILIPLLVAYLFNTEISSKIFDLRRVQKTIWLEVDRIGMST